MSELKLMKLTRNTGSSARSGSCHIESRYLELQEVKTGEKFRLWDGTNGFKDVDKFNEGDFIMMCANFGKTINRIKLICKQKAA